MPTDLTADRSRRRLDAAAGAVAAAVALGVGELVSGFDQAGTSLVTAVGDEFIDRFAGSLKELAIELFGTNDKVALVVGIVAIALAIGAWIGVATRRRPWVGPVAFAAFGVLGFPAYRAARCRMPWSAPWPPSPRPSPGTATLRFLLRLADVGAAARAERAPASVASTTGCPTDRRSQRRRGRRR